MSIASLPTVRFPKGRQLTSDPESEIARLRATNARLQAVYDFANEKVKALTSFGAHQDNALWLLALKIDPTAVPHSNNIIAKSDKAVLELRRQFNLNLPASFAITYSRGSIFIAWR